MSADPKTPLDEAREAVRLEMVDLYMPMMTRQEGRIFATLRRAYDGWKASNAEATRLTTENARLREALTALVTDCADTPMRDSRHYVAACAALAEVTRGQ